MERSACSAWNPRERSNPVRYAVDGYGVLSCVIGGMIDRMRSSLMPESISRRAARRIGLFEQGGISALHLLGCHAFNMATKQPFVAERISDRARALAVELILERADDGGAGFNRLLEGVVDVVNVQMNRECGAAQRFGSANAVFRVFVREHERCSP